MDRETWAIFIRGHLYGALYLGVAVGLIPFLLRPLDAFVPFVLPAMLRPVGVVLFLAGSGLDYWCLWLFINQGRGTALPVEPPKALVIRGPYQYVRNPIVLGMFAMILGVALYVRSPVILVYTVVGFSAYHLYILYVEEPELSQRFGTSYETYRDTVPRWLPKL